VKRALWNSIVKNIGAECPAEPPDRDKQNKNAGKKELKKLKLTDS